MKHDVKIRNCSPGLVQFVYIFLEDEEEDIAAIVIQ